MKKIGLLLIAVVLFAAGGAYFLLRTPGSPADSGYAAYLPADTLATLSLRPISCPKPLSGIFSQKKPWLGF